MCIKKKTSRARALHDPITGHACRRLRPSPLMFDFSLWLDVWCLDNTPSLLTFTRGSCAASPWSLVRRLRRLTHALYSLIQCEHVVKHFDVVSSTWSGLPCWASLLQDLSTWQPLCCERYSTAQRAGWR